LVAELSRETLSSLWPPELLAGSLQIMKCFRIQFVCVDGLRQRRDSGEKVGASAATERRSRAKLAKGGFIL
jgi:hypothetical protein